jgi:hypothetical protein
MTSHTYVPRHITQLGIDIAYIGTWCETWAEHYLSQHIEITDLNTTDRTLRALATSSSQMQTGLQYIDVPRSTNRAAAFHFHMSTDSRQCSDNLQDMDPQQRWEAETEFEQPWNPVGYVVERRGYQTHTTSTEAQSRGTSSSVYRLAGSSNRRTEDS